RIWVFWRRVLHTAHHRAQVGVCLRLLEDRVPPTYGPTADVTWATADPTRTVAAAERRVWLGLRLAGWPLPPAAEVRAMSDQPGDLTPIKPARVAQEIAKLSAARKSGELKADAYDMKFARMIQELRDRRIDGGRDEIVAALKPLLDAGDITEKEHFRLIAQLGMR